MFHFAIQSTHPLRQPRSSPCTSLTFLTTLRNKLRFVCISQTNQETNRNTVSDDADERTRFEMYYLPFIGAIEAGVGSMMCSYNKVSFGALKTISLT
jgi:hypothetical protein